VPRNPSAPGRPPTGPTLPGPTPSTDDWGPVLAAWEGWASDDEIRHRGSSGGAVTALAAFALDSGAADGVAHIAARATIPG
jgi:coenzyme F420 hydrogenase subunit beta